MPIRWLGLGLLVLGLASCATKLEPVTDLKSLRPDEVVLVGQVLLDPPLGTNEQDVENSLINPTGTDFTLPMLVLDDRHVDVSKEGLMARGDKTEYVNHPFGKTFFVKTATRPLYINSTVLYLNMNNQGWHANILQTDLMVEHKPGDRAVYVGTIRYQRNDFWDLEKVEVLDQYAGAKRDFEKKFGKGVKLVKRLARPVPQTAK